MHYRKSGNIFAPSNCATERWMHLGARLHVVIIILILLNCGKSNACIGADNSLGCHIFNLALSFGSLSKWHMPAHVRQWQKAEKIIGHAIVAKFGLYTHFRLIWLFSVSGYCHSFAITWLKLKIKEEVAPLRTPDYGWWVMHRIQ